MHLDYIDVLGGLARLFDIVEVFPCLPRYSHDIIGIGGGLLDFGLLFWGAIEYGK